MRSSSPSARANVPAPWSSEYERDSLMRIALVSPYSLSVPGGVQGQVVGLAHALRSLGHHVDVIAPGAAGDAMPDAIGAGRQGRLRMNSGLSCCPVKRRATECPPFVHVLK